MRCSNVKDQNMTSYHIMILSYFFNVITFAWSAPVIMFLVKKKTLWRIASEDLDIFQWTNFERYLQVATLISALATSDFAGIHKIGWRWTSIIWLYNIIIYMLLDPIKVAVGYALSGRAWSLVYNRRVSELKHPPTFLSRPHFLTKPANEWSVLIVVCYLCRRP